MCEDGVVRDEMEGVHKDNPSVSHQLLNFLVVFISRIWNLDLNTFLY